MILDKAAAFLQSALRDCTFPSPEQFKVQLLITPIHWQSSDGTSSTPLSSRGTDGVREPEDHPLDRLEYEALSAQSRSRCSLRCDDPGIGEILRKE